MGDRANVVIEFPPLGPPVEGERRSQRVYLYTHWGGGSLPIVLQDALRKRWRWDDPAYLARIIFCEMVKGEEMRETGFGISPYAPDNEHPFLVVSVETKTVRLEDDHERSWAAPAADYSRPHEVRANSWTFDEFCALDLNKGLAGY